MNLYRSLHCGLDVRQHILAPNVLGQFRLLQHPRRLLSRAQLLDEVWGPGTHVTDRVVDNQVTNLRKKIEPDPERPRYLIALRGLGYRFDVEGVTDR